MVGFLFVLVGLGLLVGFFWVFLPLGLCLKKCNYFVGRILQSGIACPPALAGCQCIYSAFSG